MAEPEDIEAQRELLRVYRRNLALFLQQQAEQGGSAYVTPAVANGILDARAEIAQIKTILRGWGQIVDDHPNDLPASAAPTVENAPPRLQPASLSDVIAVPATAATHSIAAIDPDGLEAYFTDVEHLREAFRQLVSTPTPPKRLLVIHGVGGSGKSSLLRMFRIYARRVGVPIALASGDEVKSVVDLLAGWSDDLQAAGVRLPTTTETLARYRAVQTTVERQAQNASAVANKLAAKTAKAVANKLAAKTAKDVVGSFAAAAVGAHMGASAEALSDWLGTFLKRPDIELVLDPTHALTEAFQVDIGKAAVQQRIVLMLDTFEQLSVLEVWARDFAQRLHPNVPLVLAGRALPSWGRAWSGWLAQTRVEELKPMTPETMRELIGRYYATMHGGEPNQAQVEAIISFARGLPVVVTSAVQLWVAYGVEDFQSVKPQVVADLVDRLLEGVPRELVPMLEAAAALRWFNKDLLRAVTQQEDVSAAYDELRRFPFIRPRAEGLALHDAVREIIDENMRVSDPERHHEWHERVARFFEAQLTNARSQEYERLELERLYHSIRADEELGIQLFQEIAESLDRYRRVSRLQAVINDVNNVSLEQENSKLWCKYFNTRLADLKEQLTYTDKEKAYRAIGENHQADLKLQAYALCDLGGLLIHRDRMHLTNDEGASVLEKAYALTPVIDSKLAFIFVYLSALYFQRCDWTRGESMLQKHKMFFEENNDQYGIIYTTIRFYTMYGWTGEWQKSLDCFAKGVELLSMHDKNTYLNARIKLRPWTLVGVGRLKDAEKGLREAYDFLQGNGQLSLAENNRRDTAYILGLQNFFAQANSMFAEVLTSYETNNSIGDKGSLLGLWGHVLIKEGRFEEAKDILDQSWKIKTEIADRLGFQEVLNWLGLASEIAASPPSQYQITAESYYLQSLSYKEIGRHYFECAALAGLVRVKHAQGDYAAIPPLLAEAEALAQQYEYNDHLASFRLSQAQLAWDVALPAHGRGFDAALSYYQQALIYALRYNRFLLDEVLWGGGVATPLKPIIPHCIERTFEGQRMLAALRDWWRSGVNDIGTPRPDTISPIPEGITLLEAERIAREREPGDGTPQRSVVNAIDGV
jgi:hypothetical protein